jgi:hypothetical protein
MTILRWPTAGTPALLQLSLSEAMVEVRIEPDPDAQPFWLGHFIHHPAPGTVRAGRNRWFVPAVPMADMEEAAALCHGKRQARRRVHEQLQADLRRLSEYGRTWTLYRVTVAVSWGGLVLGSETVSGLGEQDLPLLGSGFGGLIERLAGDLLAHAN